MWRVTRVMTRWNFHCLFFFPEFLFNFLQREIWGWLNAKGVPIRRDMRGLVRAEMFGQLTNGLESAWNKLKGEGLL